MSILASVVPSEHEDDRAEVAVLLGAASTKPIVNAGDPLRGGRLVKGPLDLQVAAAAILPQAASRIRMRLAEPAVRIPVVTARRERRAVGGHQAAIRVRLQAPRRHPVVARPLRRGIHAIVSNVAETSEAADVVDLGNS
jgi:hypothetical protein